MDYLIIWLVCGFIAAVIAQNRGNSIGTGCVIGILLGPFGIILALVSKPNTAAIEREKITSGEMKKCPHCAELIRRDANVCRFCGRDVPPAVLPPAKPQFRPDPRVAAARVEDARRFLAKGDKAKALELVTEATYRDQENEQAWLLAAQLASTDIERRRALEQAVRINPNNQAARLSLQELP